MVQNIFVFSFLMILAYSISGMVPLHKKLGSMIFPAIMGVTYIACNGWYLYMDKMDNIGLIVSLSFLAIIHGINSLSVIYGLNYEKQVVKPSVETLMLCLGVVYATYWSFYVTDTFKFALIAIEILSIAWAIMFMTRGGKNKMLWNELSNQDRYSMLILSPLVILNIVSRTIKPTSCQDELFEEEA